MHVTGSDLQTKIAHHAIRRVEEREQLRSWQGDNPARPQPTATDQLDQSEALTDRFERSAPPSQTTGTAPSNDRIPLSSEQENTLLILEKCFGITGARARIQRFHKQTATAQPQNQEASQGVGWGISYDYSKDVYESESSAISFSGTVETADGRSIDLQVDMLSQRSHHSHESLSIRAGDAALIDPIVLDLAGDGIGFSGRQVSFDLDSDGEHDDLAAFAADDLVLTLDRNGNGLIDNGRELFGPSSGQGYSELAMLDDDGNGWIDEGDSAFLRLRLGRLDNSSSISLADAGIGALHLNATVSPFSHKATDGVTDIAQVRASSLYLREDGQAGLMQQVDLVA